MRKGNRTVHLSMLIAFGIAAQIICMRAHTAAHAPNLPQGGLGQALEPIVQRLDRLHAVIGGTVFGKNSAIFSKEQVLLRFEPSGNPVVKMADKFGRTRWIEVFRDCSTYGEGKYQDEKGGVQEIRWDKDRVVTRDSYACQSLLGFIVPRYEKEQEKSLHEAIGNTSTVVLRNGAGGVSLLGGTVSERLQRVVALCNKIIESLPTNTVKEFSYLNTLLSTKLSLVENSIKMLDAKTDSLEERVKKLSDSVDNVRVVLEKVLLFIENAKIVLHCSNEECRKCQRGWG